LERVSALGRLNHTLRGLAVATIKEQRSRCGVSQGASNQINAHYFGLISWNREQEQYPTLQRTSHRMLALGLFMSIY
jgi:hypothetical protein